VQTGPVGGPPRRSADKTPSSPHLAPAVCIKHLQVARNNARGREARNPTDSQVAGERRPVWRPRSENLGLAGHPYLSIPKGRVLVYLNKHKGRPRKKKNRGYLPTFFEIF
jgi:hypothetical protein